MSNLPGEIPFPKRPTQRRALLLPVMRPIGAATTESNVEIALVCRAIRARRDCSYRWLLALFRQQLQLQAKFGKCREIIDSGH